MNEVYISADIKNEVLSKAEQLIMLHKEGKLGGEIMPEDANPGLERGSKENYLYFTLPMALNYQRNSYKLWEAAKATYIDGETNDIFNPHKVRSLSAEELKEKLLKYKVALQPNKHPEIWYRICCTLCDNFSGDVRNLFCRCDYKIEEIKAYIQKNKKLFPYLSGPKILNYWLYVMLQYTDAKFVDRENITVAPDTHVIQASVRLGLINESDTERSNVREYVSAMWNEVFKDTPYCPIDIHTPLWLWSRNGFVVKIGDGDDGQST